MYSWVLPCVAILLIFILIYTIYRITKAPEEGFIIAMPPQEYKIPEISGIQGRFIRVRPSLTNGDGYLSISQIQAIDINGNNVALNKKVTATSTGGSPLDQKYGDELLDGALYDLTPGISADPSCVTDGNVNPRRSLVNIFETGNQNGVSDAEYLEIDLSGEYIIKKIIYTGRADPIYGSFQAFEGTDTLDQVSRLTNMRLEVRNATGAITPGGQFTFSDDLTTHVTTINITTPIVTLNAGSGSVGMQTVSIPDLNSYINFAKPFKRYPYINNLPNKALMDTVNALYSAVNTGASSTTLNYTFDINDGFFSTLASDAPLNFYNEMYMTACTTTNSTYCKPNYNCCSTDTKTCGLTLVPGDGVTNASRDATTKTSPKCDGPGETIPSTPANLTVQIFGNGVASAALTEMTTSQNLCSKIFLGQPDLVENYIRMVYNANPVNIKPYIRTDFTNLLCMPEVRQVFDNGRFDTKVVSASQTWNSTRCTTTLDGTALSLLPYATRNFIIEWIYNRTLRYIHFTNSLAYSDSTALVNADALASSSVRKMIATPPPIDCSAPRVLDAIAQQFYELLGGQFSMTYIYDVCTLGSTMIDMRFDLTIHTEPTTAYGPIAALKAQYKNFRSAGSKTYTQDIVEQASEDYKIKLDQLEVEHINSVATAFQGAVVRLFYVPNGSSLTVTGMIFDDRAVTSFISQLNGGMIVPLGPFPGNTNYVPTITYTKNTPQESIVCSDTNTLRRVMDDYTDMVQNNNSILLKSSTPIDTSKGTLFVHEVNSYAQISPTQCAYEWLETLYDSNTNIPIPIGPTTSDWMAKTCGLNSVRRYGIFSYKVDQTNWSSPDLIYDPSGFAFLSSTTLPACAFDEGAYRKSVGNRFRTLGSSATASQTVQRDFLNTTFKNGTGPVCPQSVPGYTFNAADYLAANPGLSGVTTATALTHYMTTGLAQGLNIRTTSTLTPFSSGKVTYNKPLPMNSNLTNASGLCPTTSCENLDVLYSLVDQYNANPTLPGSILRVKRAFTPNPFQCDVEVDVNYDSMIQDQIGRQIQNAVTGITTTTYPMIKKGTVTYNVGKDNKFTEGSQAMTRTGIQIIKMSLSLNVDSSTCSYMLVGATQDAGQSIQTNTPYLYKPLDYVAQLAQTATSVGSSIAQIQSDFSSISGSVKDTITAYRANTYAAIGDINTLKVCPGMSCNNASVMSAIQNMIQYDLSTWLSIGTTNDGQSCDVTYTNATQQTVAKRFKMVSGPNATCTPSTYTSITPTPTYSDVKNMSAPLNTANTYKVSGFTDYSEAVTDDAPPLKAGGFGLDRARNAKDSYREMQYKEPLKQNPPLIAVDVTPEAESQAYRFLRFVPIKTRDPDAFTVSVNKFTFFYEGSPILLEGATTNPMGTWEGSMKDLTGPGIRQGWSDAHKKPLVFAFKAPIRVDAYSFTTSGESLANDPVVWKLEGSRNGTFWTLLDTQQRFPTPVERLKEVGPLAFGI